MNKPLSSSFSNKQRIGYSGPAGRPAFGGAALRRWGTDERWDNNHEFLPKFFENFSLADDDYPVASPARPAALGRVQDGQDSASFPS